MAMRLASGARVGKLGVKFRAGTTSVPVVSDESPMAVGLRHEAAGKAAGMVLHRPNVTRKSHEFQAARNGHSHTP